MPTLTPRPGSEPKKLLAWPTGNTKTPPSDPTRL